MKLKNKTALVAFNSLNRFVHYRDVYNRGSCLRNCNSLLSRRIDEADYYKKLRDQPQYYIELTKKVHRIYQLSDTLLRRRQDYQISPQQILLLNTIKERALKRYDYLISLLESAEEILTFTIQRPQLRILGAGKFKVRHGQHSSASIAFFRNPSKCLSLKPPCHRKLF